MTILLLDDAKMALRVDGDHEDLLIQGYCDAAQAWVERVTGPVANPAPADIVQAARMLVAHWYDNRMAVSEAGLQPVPFGVKALIANHRSFAHGDIEGVVDATGTP